MSVLDRIAAPIVLPQRLLEALDAMVEALVDLPAFERSVLKRLDSMDARLARIGAKVDEPVATDLHSVRLQLDKLTGRIDGLVERLPDPSAPGPIAKARDAITGADGRHWLAGQLSNLRPMAGAPAALSHNPLVRIVADVRAERAARTESAGFPPGESSFSLARTHRMATDPLPVLLDCYERFGPVFSLRMLHALHVFVIGPEANHHVTVANARNFHWREGGFGELEPLLGAGLLTIDGDYHRRARQIMLPAFHRESIAAASETMVAETQRALAGWRLGETLDVYARTRELAMRIAMRALLGLDPDDGDTGATAAHEFERALHFFGTEYSLRVLRGPGSPWSRMLRSRAALDTIVFAEIERRRGQGAGSRAAPEDGLLGMLMAATDENGSSLSDREIRDQAVTLLFAGHDTTTSTVSFLLHELARHPRELELLLTEQDRVLEGGRAPTAADLTGGMPRLEMVLDEVLRLYPPAWIGPRWALGPFEVAGTRVPGGVAVNYCSWASHRLPEVFPNPEAFLPDRFEAGRKAALPKGAYVPFGGGSRTCLGMRFGQLEVKVIATLVLQRFGLELLPGRTMSVRQMPTLSPRGGLRMRVRERVPPATAPAS